MNAKDARQLISKMSRPDFIFSVQEYKEALRTACIALRHEEKMERIADLEAQEEATLTLEDLLYLKVQTETLEHLLHHLPDHIVDHIAFICESEMKDRYAKMDKLEKECEA